MMSGGTMSGRVERTWPNFTNVGPSSSSISRRCTPRWFAALGTTGSALPERQQVGQLVLLDEVAEAVPDRDLRDLGQAPEVALLRPRRHGVSFARGPSKALPCVSG